MTLYASMPWLNAAALFYALKLAFVADWCVARSLSIRMTGWIKPPEAA